MLNTGTAARHNFDLIGIRIEDVHVGSMARDRASIVQKITKKFVQFEIGSRAESRFQSELDF